MDASGRWRMAIINHLDSGYGRNGEGGCSTRAVAERNWATRTGRLDSAFDVTAGYPRMRKGSQCSGVLGLDALVFDEGGRTV